MCSQPSAENRFKKLQQSQPAVYNPLHQGSACLSMQPAASNKTYLTASHLLKIEGADPLLDNVPSCFRPSNNETMIPQHKHTKKKSSVKIETCDIPQETLTVHFTDVYQSELSSDNHSIKLEVADPLQPDTPIVSIQASSNCPSPLIAPKIETCDRPQVTSNFSVQSAIGKHCADVSVSTQPHVYDPLLQGPAWFLYPAANCQTRPKPTLHVKVETCDPLDLTDDLSMKPEADVQPDAIVKQEPVIPDSQDLLSTSEHQASTLCSNLFQAPEEAQKHGPSVQSCLPPAAPKPRSAAKSASVGQRSAILHTRLSFLNEEYEMRMSQLASEAAQQAELHELRISEAKAELRTAESRARKQEILLIRAQQEVEFRRENYRLLEHHRREMDKMREMHELDVKRLRK